MSHMKSLFTGEDPDVGKPKANWVKHQPNIKLCRYYPYTLAEAYKNPRKPLPKGNDE